MYKKAQYVCDQAERYRAKITQTLNPYVGMYEEYYPQPKHTPRCYFSVHNMEAIVLQLFTPKLPVRTYYDEKSGVIRMRRMPKEIMVPKEFLPLPKEFLSPAKDDVVDGASVIVEENQPRTAVDVSDKQEEQTREDFEPYT